MANGDNKSIIKTMQGYKVRLNNGYIAYIDNITELMRVIAE